MNMSEWMGLLIGSIIVLTIQFTIGNPFIWLDDKLSERRRKREHFKEKSYVCDDHCFWGYEDCPHCKKDEEGL